MKTAFKIFSLGLFLLIVGTAALALFVPASSYAQVKISTSIPGSADANGNAAAAPGAIIANFYQYALIIGGILAFGVVVYGGIRYMTSAGNPSGQGDAKEWIQAAIMGILLLAGAYFILNVINPNLLNLTLPGLQGVGQTNTSGGGGGAPSSPSLVGTTGNGNPLPTQQACNDLTSAGIGVSCSMLNGIQSSTVDMMLDLKKECPGSNLSVTAVTNGSHSTRGGFTHSSGYKADMRPNSSLDSCVTGFQDWGNRVGDGAKLYRAPDGAIFADERTRPPRCGSNCQWTGSHWDVQAGSVK